MIVYVYNDEDHCNIEVYERLEDALKEGWGEDEDEEDEPWQVARTDKKTKEPVAWRRGEYCAIYKREVL